MVSDGRPFRLCRFLRVRPARRPCEYGKRRFVRRSMSFHFAFAFCSISISARKGGSSRSQQAILGFCVRFAKDRPPPPPPRDDERVIGLWYGSSRVL